MVPVPRGEFPEERRAELGRALQRPVVDVDQPESGAVTGGPLEIVHRAPVEIPFDGYPVGGRPLQLREIAAEEHDAVAVVDGAVRGRLVRRAAAVLGDVDLAKDMPYTADTDRTLRWLAALRPQPIALMHGSTFRGDGERALLDLATVIRETLGTD